MNRRNFIGAMIASASVNKVVESIVSPASPSQSRQGAWLRGGLIDAGGTHEPYIFVVRRGGQRLDARQIYDHEQSETLIRQLQEQGIEVFHTHLYKGFGMAAEMPEMEDTKRAVAIAHRLGMKADTYIQWNSLMYETFFAEEPRAKDWIQCGINGRPILLTYGYQQSFRYRPCFANSEYLAYLMKIVRYAVEEVHTDFIHFDNFDLNPEPDSCHCAACVEGFRKFLKTKYSPSQRRDRFGFENTDFVNPPQWNRDNPPEKMEVVFDPAFQEWIDFRCQLMADALRQISEYAKSLNPEVAIEINPGGITGANRAWEDGIDHARLLKWTESFWSEEDDPPAYHADGRLISKIRSYKLARTYHNILLTHLSNDPVDMAESLAFNQSPGFVGANPIHPEILKYIAFYRQHRDLYADTEDVTPVAVLRSYASLTYHNARAQLSAILVEQALIQSKIPFGLIFDEHLHHLAHYKVLILPDSECLSDEQIAFIRRFVENGGGLVATEQAGLYDEWRRVRAEPGLQGLVDRQISGSEYQEHVVRRVASAGIASRKEVGLGRVVYLPSVEFDGPLPPPEPYFAVSKRFWKRPQNWEEVINAVCWTAKGEIALEVDGPEFLVVNLLRQPRKQRMLVHLTNYGARTAPSIRSVEVRCHLRKGSGVRNVTLYSPDVSGAVALSVNTRGSAISFSVPEMKTYAVVAIQE